MNEMHNRGQLFYRAHFAGGRIQKQKLANRRGEKPTFVQSCNSDQEVLTFFGGALSLPGVPPGGAMIRAVAHDPLWVALMAAKGLPCSSRDPSCACSSRDPSCASGVAHGQAMALNAFVVLRMIRSWPGMRVWSGARKCAGIYRYLYLPILWSRFGIFGR